MKMIFQIGAAILAALTLSACGGEGELDGAAGSVDFAGAQSMISNTSFTAAFDQLKMSSTTVTAPPFAVAGISTMTAGAANYAGCTVQAGSTTDADSDGVRKSVRREFNCNTIPDNNGVVSLNGYYLEKDLDDAVAGMKGGFQFETEYRKLTSYDIGAGDMTWKGLWQAKTSGATSSIQSLLNFTEDFVGVPGKHESYFVKYRTNWMQQMKANDINSPHTSGVMNLEGFHGVEGEFTAAGGGGKKIPVKVTFEIKAKNLSYRAACGQFFENGDITWTDSAGNVLKYAYGACGTLVKTFNGRTL